MYFIFTSFFSFYCPLSHLLSNFPALFRHLQEMSDLKKYNPPPGSADLYMAASKHFQQAKLILENVPSPDPEVRKRQLRKINARLMFKWIPLLFPLRPGRVAGLIRGNKRDPSWHAKPILLFNVLIIFFFTCATCYIISQYVIQLVCLYSSFYFFYCSQLQITS